MPDVRLIHGDALASLRTLAAGSVHTCITSPPFFGLRDYGTGRWEGGDAACDHRKWHPRPDHSGDTYPGTRGEQGSRAASAGPQGHLCGQCGARRIDRQLGLEATVEEYVARLVEVFREVRRVLRDDGTLWLNLGDSYNTRAPGPGVVNFYEGPRTAACASAYPSGFVRVEGLADKQLLGVPWRVAFALQADGWILRSDIIWSKPNPMPESVRDRPTKSHEYLFLLSKEPRYYYDAEAIKEEAVCEGIPQTFARPCRAARAFGNPSGGELHADRSHIPNGRNRRSVWTITPKPFKGAHFATFPPALVEPCVLAGTSERGCCPGCGAPWRRVVEWHRIPTRPGASNKFEAGMNGEHRTKAGLVHRPETTTTTTGWRPSCTCPPADPIPCTVLDPFAGACSAGVAAVRRDRRFIGIDLNAHYLEMGRRRLVRVLGPLFANLPVEG